MTAKIKILLTVLLSAVLLLFVKYKVDGMIVEQGFFDVETEEICRSGEQLRTYYNRSLEFLNNVVSWSAYPDCRHIVEEGRYSFIIFSDSDGQITDAEFRVPEALSIGESTFKSLLLAGYEEELTTPDYTGLQGIMVVDNKPFIVVSAPIHAKGGSASGRIAVGLYFDFESVVFKHEAEAQVSFKRVGRTKGLGLQKYITYLDRIDEGKCRFYVDRNRADTVDIYDVWTDVRSQPVFISKIRQKRISMIKGQEIVKLSLWVSLISNIIIILIVSFTLHIFIVHPISVLSTYAASLEDELDFDDRHIIKIDLPEEVKGLAGSFDRVLNKVSADKKALQSDNMKLKRLVKYDDLTKVASRRSFDYQLEREWRLLKESPRNLSLIFCDIDYFKLYNDTYGHAKGDETLRKVAAILNNTVKREEDMVARYGGEEFVILLPGTALEGAELIAHKLRDAVDNSRITHARSEAYGHVTISLGVAAVRCADKLTKKEFIEAADKALYKAKINGRNMVVVAS